MYSVLEIISEAPESAGPDLISLDDLKLALGITGSTEDAELQAAITFQSRIIAEYCDRRFGRAEAMETFTFNRRDVLTAPLPHTALVLALYPVAEILEVSTGSDYDLDPVSGRLWFDGWSADPVAVTYSGGYDLPEEAPARLQKAVIEAVQEGRTSGSRDPSIREVQHGDTRISYFTSSLSSASPGYLSAPVVDLIRPYRRITIA